MLQLETFRKQAESQNIVVQFIKLFTQIVFQKQFFQNKTESKLIEYCAIIFS